ncbi:MAG TPA: Dyp-type peroxidase [Acidimicrobiales bacterium]|nr:Dyp-type peroxidase [Acidimicrobiales bacterium]
MATPQPGIFALGTRSHHHLELELTGPVDRLIPAINRVREAATTVVGVNMVVGFGPALWARLRPDAAPEGLSAFETITGVDDLVMAGRQHDVWMWFHGAGPDDVFDIARLAAVGLRGVADVVCERPSFVYQSSQDLTGFEDGTENPPLGEAYDVATISDDDAAAGCSVALLQRWVHDLDGFEALEEADREAVIGRTLHGSIELDDHRQEPDSHIRRVVIEGDEGEELEVFRRSTAFGGVLEHGLMFLGFTNDWRVLHRMLERMAGLDDGVRDRLTRFSTPVASAWYVVPSLEHLRALGDGSST